MSSISQFSEGCVVYRALLTQSGVNAPVATVLEQSIVGTIVWTRNAAGHYYGTLAGAFPAGKAFVLTYPHITQGNGNPPVNLFAFRDSDNIVSVITAISDVYTDGLLYETPIEIRVYE